ncbi:MAG: thioredoxin domain-containing protein, partial [Saprospiraceae bacterium]|nr:thioredoxin domain-containing protein [Saprospiraceae bacterium]
MANQLQYETSPYLLQHAHNPVDWYPWGEPAFERARKENKPIMVSIGYSTCHWCHVMERESFEDQDVAAFMNRFFVNIKVDREERPDVDHLYMEAC